MKLPGRLRPGVNSQQASAELHALAHQFAVDKKSSYFNSWDLFLSDPAHMTRGIFGDVSAIVPYLAFCRRIILALVCTNVTVLLIQRGLTPRA